MFQHVLKPILHPPPPNSFRVPLFSKSTQFLADVDEDGSGLLEFKEFASFIAKVKGGNPKYKGFSKLANTVNATPISLLEDQAKQRDFKVSFELVEEVRGGEEQSDEPTTQFLAPIAC